MSRFLDCFTFSGFGPELDLLEVRLASLYDVVDYFVIAEGNKTQTLKDKYFNFELNKDRFTKWQDKIIYIKVDMSHVLNDNYIWTAENSLRNALSSITSFKDVNLQDDDIIAISDLDEIPYSETISKIKKWYASNSLERMSIEMMYVVYEVDLYAKTCIGTNTYLYKALKGQGNNWQFVRDTKDHVSCVANGGVHYGYLGGPQLVYEKYFNCIEPLDKSKIPDYNTFSKIYQSAAKDNGYFIFIDDVTNKSIPLVRIGLSHLHSYFKDSKLYWKYTKTIISESELLDKYKKDKCQRCWDTKNLITFRQNTTTEENEALNYITLCPICYQEFCKPDNGINKGYY